MQVRQFYIMLGFITAFTGLLLWLMASAKSFDTGIFAYLGLTFFVVFSIVIFHMGLHAAKHQNKNKFTGVVMSMIFMKLVFTLAIVLIYDKKIAPLRIEHIVSFLISYLFFTFFEVYFMSKLARWHL